MEIEKSEIREMIKKDLTDIFIRVALVGFLVYISLKIFNPFLGIMIWALIFAVIFFPMHQKLANKLGGNQGRSATIFVLCGVLFLGVPTVMLSGSLVDFIQETHSKYSSESFTVNPPKASVAEWPIIGKKVFDLWEQAAKDLPRLLKKLRPQLEGFAKGVLESAANIAGGLLQFLLSMIFAGIMLAYGQSGSDAILRVINRLAGHKKGVSLHKLSTATIRSVAMGVVGVSTIQALIFGTPRKRTPKDPVI